ncbi:predicted protein [Chaetomium globosum CBS 148.51]|uniref:Uncharacterized protein n=1 Tax=Chaetomium globosum (strain ATCC 6205 / CBS 148.51 / DSM 1962 / NBRC 6347 / NRRL 1970) TaxID=306901 RepID=Q2GSK3_CHAGB|nr:uncharacterized protein CHGG_09051 [Chaetomium globosum CBS 148.51]EAQ85037.1 predicted protein [Chaetomium globosum CBS 148.51]
MASTTTCPSVAIPDLSTLAVPHDINLMVIPGTSTEDSTMNLCCEPSPVHVIDRCWVWCELPASYWVNGTQSNDAVQQACRRRRPACGPTAATSLGFPLPAGSSMRRAGLGRTR